MLLHQIYYGLIHNLVYMAAMTVDFNITASSVDGLLDAFRTAVGK